MTSIATENLEERIERIRKRTEEIEKKHRAAEEDRLMALMDNAMVKTKPPKDEDWPKAHKYDKLDFTYDIKPEKLEENIIEQQKQQQLIKPKRDYKKFADGEGPPPDPIYNFLADAERDGNILQHQKEQQHQQQQKNYDNKKDLKQNQLNNSGNGRNIDNNNIKTKDQFNKRGGGNGQQNNNNSSFRNRGGSSGGGNNNINGNNGKTQQNNRYQKQQNSQTENQKQNLQPEQWRCEKIDDNIKTNNRQKMNGNNCEKWRRGSDWDNNDAKIDKNNSNDLQQNNKSPKHNNNNANKNYYQHHNNQQQQQQLQQSYHQQNISNNIYTPVENIIEKRGNIMVSVSPGEVKSVKLTSAQVIGSGRVGPRQVTKPQFHIQTMEKEQQQQQQLIENITVPISPRPQINSGHQQQLNKLNNFNNQQQNNIHNNYQQYATKNTTIPPTHRLQQTTTIIQPQLNNNNTNNNGITLAPKSPIKDKRNLKSSKYTSPQHQQQKPIIVGGGGVIGAGDNILISPTNTNPIIVNNMVNNLLNATANTVNGVGAGVATNSVTIKNNVDINVPEIDVKVLAVAKELSNKPEFAKKSVQDRLLRIRQMSQPDVVSPQQQISGDYVDHTTNNNNIVDQLININDNLNATLLIKDANKDEQNDSIKNVETIVACN